MKELELKHMESLYAGDTMSCVNDAYTNHGWVSAWAFVQTLFIPATGVAIVAACALRNM
jgi:hypothetical protein